MRQKLSVGPDMEIQDIRVLLRSAVFDTHREYVVENMHIPYSI